MLLCVYFLVYLQFGCEHCISVADSLERLIMEMMFAELDLYTARPRICVIFGGLA